MEKQREVNEGEGKGREGKGREGKRRTSLLGTLLTAQ